MDAYRKGLLEKALIWAVRKFRQHRCILESALSALEAVSEDSVPKFCLKNLADTKIAQKNPGN